MWERQYQRARVVWMCVVRSRFPPGARASRQELCRPRNPQSSTYTERDWLTNGSRLAVARDLRLAGPSHAEAL
jgi:hypothetical protein